MANAKSKSQAKRLKALALPTPANQKEAEALLLRIGGIQNKLKRMEATMNDKLARVRSVFEEEADPLQLELEQKFQALHLWAESNRGDLLTGDRKTAKLATGEISWRMTPPKVAVRGVKSVIEAIKTLRLGKKCLRIKEEIDKTAILGDPKLQKKVQTISGVTITQQEEFSAKPFASELELVQPIAKSAA